MCIYISNILADSRLWSYWGFRFITNTYFVDKFYSVLVLVSTSGTLPKRLNLITKFLNLPTIFLNLVTNSKFSDHILVLSRHIPRLGHHFLKRGHHVSRPSHRLSYFSHYMLNLGNHIPKFNCYNTKFSVLPQTGPPFSPKKLLYTKRS